MYRHTSWLRTSFFCLQSTNFSCKANLSLCYEMLVVSLDLEVTFVPCVRSSEHFSCLCGTKQHIYLCRVIIKFLSKRIVSVYRIGNRRRRTSITSEYFYVHNFLVYFVVHFHSLIGTYTTDIIISVFARNMRCFWLWLLLSTGNYGTDYKPYIVIKINSMSIALYMSIMFKFYTCLCWLKRQMAWMALLI